MSKTNDSRRIREDSPSGNSKEFSIEEIKRIVEENNKMLKEIVERFFNEKPHKFFQRKSHNEGFKEE
jgi:hypothetical protein